MQEQDRMLELLEERKLSANERELNRYVKEDREKRIKEDLEYMRKKRQDDITYNHNPLNVKNITNHTDWEVMKEKNMFSNNKNMFANQEYIHKSNNKLLNSGNCLKGKNLFKLK